MVEVIKSEIDDDSFKRIYNNITEALAYVDPKLNLKERSAQIFEVIRKSFGATFVIVQSSDVYYSIQAEPNSLVILTIDKAKMLAFKPKSQVKPMKLSYCVPSDETIKTFISENRVPNIEELTVVKNTLLNDKDLRDLKNVIAVYLNKNKEQYRYLYKFLSEIKPFVLAKTGRGVFHLFFTDVRCFNCQIIQEKQSCNETREIKIELRLVKEKATYILNIFESKSSKAAFITRLVSQWRDFLVYLFMFFIVSILSVCKEPDRFKGADVQLLCRNQIPILLVLGSVVVYLVIAKSKISKKMFHKNKKVRDN